jgi:L-aminopeptidase/D-esterase-like protein
VAVNPFGDVVDPQNGQIIAGTRKPLVGGFLDTAQTMSTALGQTILGMANTTIGVVATNAPMNKIQCTKVAQMAHDGLALAIRPVHTMVDGDAVFAVATGKAKAGFLNLPGSAEERANRARFWTSDAETTVIGTAAVRVLARAIVRAAQQASGLAGVPAASDL